MPKGPQGQDRPTDVIGAAIRVARLSVGMEAEELKAPSGKVRSGHAGAKARAASMTKEERIAVAKKAAAARWR